MNKHRAVAKLVLALGIGLGMPWAQAGPVADRVKASAVVRVCIWPAYFGITYREPASGRLSGLDIDLAQALAQDLGAQVQWVESSFVSLVDDLLDDRCDVAMFGVGMLPQRMARLAFTQPYMKSDMYGMARRDNPRMRAWEDIDKPGIRVAVQAGTFMEPVMKESLKQGQLLPVQPPQTREKAVEAGQADVFMTDFPYSRRVLSQSDTFKLIRPARAFFELPYAYAVKPGDAAWLQRLDAFVARIKQDGRLDSAAARHGLSDIVIRR